MLFLPRSIRMRTHLRMVGLLAALGGLLSSGVSRGAVDPKPGQLIVVDKANLFSDGGISRAKDEFARLQSKTGRQVMVETLAKLPDGEAAKLAAIDPKDATGVRRFWHDHAVSMAK